MLATRLLNRSLRSQFRHVVRCQSATASALHSKLDDDTMAVVNATAPVVAENIDKITSTFYPRMFSNNPEVFAFFNQSNQRAGKQPAALAASVVAAVGHLNNLADIRPALDLIGHKHCALGVLPEHYQIVHDNFLGAVAEVLGDAVTPEIAKAWSNVLMHVAGACIEVEHELYEQVSGRQNSWNGRETKPFVIKKIEDAGEDTKSFYLGREDGTPVPEYTPGQYATLHINPTDAKLFAPRHYTISAPGPIDDCLRITVRHVKGTGSPDGVVSSWLHQAAATGASFEVRPPFGEFTADKVPTGTENVVVLTAGIGATPASAIAPHLAKNSSFNVGHIHADVSAARHVLKDEMDSSVRTHYHYDAADPAKFLKPTDVTSIVNDFGFNLNSTHFFICGPPSFMKSMVLGLKDSGVADSHLAYEAFGPTLAVMRS